MTTVLADDRHPEVGALEAITPVTPTDDLLKVMDVRIVGLSRTPYFNREVKIEHILEIVGDDGVLRQTGATGASELYGRLWNVGARH